MTVKKDDEEDEADEANKAGKKGGDPDYEDGMVQARHLQLRQAKFLPPQPRHRTNYLISVYSACRLHGSTTELTLASRRIEEKPGSRELCRYGAHI